ncbi:MAG: hypothetical protein AAGA36_06580 [Pseudomonadota bacterium]
MAATVFSAGQLSEVHRRLFVIGTLMCLIVLGSSSLAFTYVYGPSLHPPVFWSCVIWLMLLVLIVWAVYSIRLSSRVEGPMSLTSKLNFKSGATIIAVGFAVLSATLLVVMAESIRVGTPDYLFVIGQFLLLVLFIALLALRFTELVPGLPPQAAEQAEANVASLQMRLDELEELFNSDFLRNEIGKSHKGRLKAALTWWREELATSMPQSGLEMSQPFISYFLDNVSRDTLFIRDICASETPVDDEQVMEAERRVIEGISRTGQIVRKLRPRAVA